MCELLHDKFQGCIYTLHPFNLIKSTMHGRFRKLTGPWPLSFKCLDPQGWGPAPLQGGGSCTMCYMTFGVFCCVYFFHSFAMWDYFFLLCKIKWLLCTISMYFCLCYVLYKTFSVAMCYIKLFCAMCYGHFFLLDLCYVPKMTFAMCYIKTLQGPQGWFRNRCPNFGINRSRHSWSSVTLQM